MGSALYNKLMRYCTAGILGAIALIILATTFSTDDWVVAFGKTMYWLVVSLGVFSLVLWAARTRFERGAAGPSYAAQDQTAADESEA